MRSCLKDSFINSEPMIENYINKLELYRQCPLRGVKDTKISEIENTSCVRNFMRVNPVSVIEREPWVAASILLIVNDGVYICTCSVRSDEYKFKTKHAFVFDSHFKYFHQSRCCGALIDNISDARICFFEDNKEIQSSI